MPSTEDVQSLFREIASHWPNEYTDRMAYQDFNAVFLSTEMGQRVLYRIFEKCRLYSTPIALFGENQDRVSNELTYANVGRQDVARFILNMLLNEPPPETPPANAVTVDPSTKE